jgi:hypothetical protein
MKMVYSYDMNGKKEDGEMDDFPRCATALTRQCIITSSAFITDAPLDSLQYTGSFSLHTCASCKLLVQIPAALELEKCIFQQSVKLTLVAATQTRRL